MASEVAVDNTRAQEYDSDKNGNCFSITFAVSQLFNRLSPKTKYKHHNFLCCFSVFSQSPVVVYRFLVAAAFIFTTSYKTNNHSHIAEKRKGKTFAYNIPASECTGGYAHTM